MKKFYAALALGAAVSLSAAAAPVSLNSMKSFVPADQVSFEVAPQIRMENPAKDVKNTRAAADILGDYEGWYYNNLQNSAGYEGIFLQIKEKDGKYYLAGLPNNFEAEGTIGATSFSVAPQTVAANLSISGQNCDVKLIHKRWNDNGQGNYDTTEPIEFVYNAESDSYTLAEWQDLLGVAVYSGNNLLGYFLMGYAFHLEKSATTLSNEGWIDLGDADFTDGFVTPGMTQDGSAMTWKVPAQRNQANPNIIRLVDPYRVSNVPTGFEQYNASQSAGAIYFNIENPNSVYVVPGIYSGMILASGYTFLPFYPSTWPSYYKYVEGFDDEDIEDGFGEEERGFYDAEKNTITIHKSAWAEMPYYRLTNSQTGEVLVTPCELYYWSASDESELYVETVVVLPNGAGVGEISAEDANAPVKYYNLQGMEIEAPAKGELVIKKAGSKSTKVIF